MSDEFTNKVVVVTGGGSGIGRATCKQFAAAGAHVVVVDVSEETGQETVDSIGQRASFIHTDVSDSDSVKHMVDSVMYKFGRIDVLYNNAAATNLCNIHDRPVHELDESVWDEMIDICLKSVFLCSKYTLPHMMEQHRGVIINTTSTNAQIAEPGYDSYTAAKGGVISLTRSMATEYAPYNIRVNAISPGYIITECQQWYNENDEARKAADAMHLTRIGRPDDVANMAVYLASDKAEFITGAIMNVDGGLTAFKGKKDETPAINVSR